MKDLQEIKQLLLENKDRLFAEYPLKAIGLFGSYTRREETSASDIDILVEFNGPIGLAFMDLAEDLEKCVGQKVDLVSRNGIKPKYFNAIKKDLVYV
ncbi:MAG: nucleotidyltransferase family protein [Mongoliitalea sp.]